MARPNTVCGCCSCFRALFGLTPPLSDSGVSVAELGPEPERCPEWDFEVEFEVRLLSGEPVGPGTFRLPGSSTVRDLCNLVAAGPKHPAMAKLLMQGAHEFLQPSCSLAEAGVAGRTLQLLWQEFTWEDHARGANVTTERDMGGLRATRTQSYSDALVVALRPCRYFRFRVLDNTGRFHGGVEFGFTASQLSADFVPPRNALELKDAWSVTFNHGPGHTARMAEAKRRDAKNRLERADAGDLIEVSAIPGCIRVQIMSVPLDGPCQEENALEFEVPLQGLPEEQDLYPMVSVYGKCQSVLLIDG